MNTPDTMPFSGDVADPGPRSLAELEARLQRDLELLVMPPPKEWLEPRVHRQWGPVLDVAIIGAGMAGLAAAFALKRLGVRNLQVFDRSPEGFEGPWATYARMEVLRSPPELAGPALGLANLTFRAWFEAQFGAAAWKKVHRIPRPQWMDYLRWYRDVIDVPIENGTELIDITGDAETVLLTLRSASGVRKAAARRLILANGRDALGGPYVPELFRKLDRRYWAHTSEDIDFEALRGKTVGVIGAGASAVDNAAEALEAGAARVAMLVRRPDVPRINKGMGIGSPGLWLGFNRLTLAQRWLIVQYIDDQAIPPPRDSMLRCSRHPNFSIFARCSLREVAVRDGRVMLDTSRGLLAFDYVILATGFAIDWEQRPELASLRPHIALWGERFAAPDRASYAQADHPFLGSDFEFIARDPNAAPWVSRVHCFTYPAFLSHGPITGDVPGITAGTQQIADGVAGALFAEDYERVYRKLQAWDSAELRGDEYVLSDDIKPFLAETAKSEVKA
jgi:cation diffusion facilitator CzcD-associated flavoprotein CzcO